MEINEKIIIEGNRPLTGEVTISGAKNSAVALIPAAILADSPVILEGVPDIQDVHSLIEILEIMGAKIHFSQNILEIDPRGIVSVPMPSGKINSLRASYYFMGALLGKFGEAVVGLPGGCYLGPRPIDLHVKGSGSIRCFQSIMNMVRCIYGPTNRDYREIGFSWMSFQSVQRSM